MNVLTIDVGGTHVKILATGQIRHREFDSGPTLTPEQMVTGVKDLAKDWKYDAVSIGYPGPVVHGRPVAEPHNLGPAGSASTSSRVRLPGQDHQRRRHAGPRQLQGRQDALPRPRHRSRLGHDRRRHHRADGAGPSSLQEGDVRGLRRRARLAPTRQEEMAQCVADVVQRLAAALEPDDVVLGGGNVKKLKELPPGCRLGDNANAFLGGFRLWDDAAAINRILQRLHRPPNSSQPERTRP